MVINRVEICKMLCLMEYTTVLYCYEVLFMGGEIKKSLSSDHSIS